MTKGERYLGKVEVAGSKAPESVEISAQGSSFSTKAHFDAKQDLTWQYLTAVGVKEITGTQKLELIIKQPLGTSSEWIASLPEVEISWRSRWIQLKSAAGRLIGKGKKISRIEPKFETFKLPKA